VLGVARPAGWPRVLLEIVQKYDVSALVATGQQQASAVGGPVEIEDLGDRDEAEWAPCSLEAECPTET